MRDDHQIELESAFLSGIYHFRFNQRDFFDIELSGLLDMLEG